MRKMLLLLSSLMMLSGGVLAQDAGSEDILEDSLQDAYTVIALGSAGAVLGLSTLSFVEEPSEHLKNVVVGGAIGIILGVGVVAWQQAGKSKSMYNESTYFNRPEKGLSTSKRIAWHHHSHKSLMAQRARQDLSSFVYSLSF